MEVLTFDNHAEIKAAEAEKLNAFNGLNLQYIKRQTEKILGLIGRGSIFEEYTYHDISHIDFMLRSLEWIIPDDTKIKMTATDWLLIVLGIYFHDMGMLVTAKEFESRNNSGFIDFKSNLLSGNSGEDLKEKLANMEDEKKEKFLYQEFVRVHHAIRIRNWIEGKEDTNYGVSQDIQEELKKLLEPLGEVFREDLALICESHHLDDLHDLNKYKISKPYGNSVAETANLQYSAILLRTADLLHITSDRTPTVSYNIISPSDPISQDEWAKQRAVRSVRAALGKDKQGNIKGNIQSDTIEVHATFSKKDGFFGLTSYLDYAEDQLEKSYKIVKLTREKMGSEYEFPWRKIDQNYIETNGFLKESFNFILDPIKILDLLTGHTLYNDSSVVIRELIQNSLDAIRLQEVIDSQNGQGKVIVRWNSEERILEVIDNGTGMTQEVIVNYFLRAGVSKYQDPKFKEKFPDFSPISRFGIGILSTFMIADNVEIITNSLEEEKARHISLRTVHGKYLIELLDKNARKLKEIESHGTIVKLKVRPSVNMDHVLETVKKWIMFPRSELIVQIDSEEYRVGYSSPLEAVEDFLSVNEYSESLVRPNKIKVIEKEINGVKLAFAVKWSDYFKEWSFLTLSDDEEFNGDINNDYEVHLGLCIEGIRVEFTTPGFSKNRIVAIADVKGLNGPKTNVAREGIEQTEEYNKVLQAIYQIYCSHIESEMEQLKNRNYSLTWVVNESAYLLNPLLSGRYINTSINEEILMDEINKIPTLIVETNGEREAISPKNIKEFKEFCTIQSKLYSNLESLVKELQGNVSVSDIINNIKIQDYELPQNTILYVKQNKLFESVLDKMDVKKIVVNRPFRSVELHWEKTISKKIWIEPPFKKMDNFFRREYFMGGHSAKKFSIATSQIEVEGLDKEIGVIQGDTIYLLYGTKLNEYCINLLSDRDSNKISDFKMSVLFRILSLTITKQLDEEKIDQYIERYLRDISPSLIKEIENEGYLETLTDLVSSNEATIYDSTKWVR
ncbi:ATP-binding protein [Bacillus safensis]|uniref:HD domain-containing protein n=1 Tax=Bacillus TaxID=1386 RepID=UPI000750994B|nr:MULTISPECIES: ATP-binding protein [Bacillus]KUR62494.1 hypothetical protein AOQ70_11860 [Bacillus sp. AM 13(2015)]PCK13553.1 ATP-binding protein [Bacillus safensis]